MNLDTQFLTLITMVASGVVVSALYDTYKLLLRPDSYSSRVIVDTLFFLTQGCLVFYLLFLTNGGVIRFYLFLAVLLGISAYFALFQTIFLAVLERLIRVLIRVYQLIKRLIYNLVLRPLFWVIQILVTILVGILNFVWKIVSIIFRAIWFLLEPLIPQFIQNYLLKWLADCSKIITKAKKEIYTLLRVRRRKNGEANSK